MFQRVSSYLRVNILHIHHKDQSVDKTQGNNNCVFLNTNKSAVLFNVTAYGTQSYNRYAVCGSCILNLGLMVHIVLSITQLKSITQ
jgi:hypothetical protein